MKKIYHRIIQDKDGMPFIKVTQEEHFLLLKLEKERIALKKKQ